MMSHSNRLVDLAINDALRIVTECLRPTPADNLPILAGIQPAELRRNGTTLSLARHAIDPGHLLQSALTCPPSANARRLKSRHPFMLAAQQLISSSDNNIPRTCGALDGSPMSGGLVGQPYENPYFHLRHRHLAPRNSPPKKNLGPA